MRDKSKKSKTMRRTLNLWPDTGRMLGLGRNATFSGAKIGEIKTIRIGRRLLVPRAWLEEVLAGKVPVGGKNARQALYARRN